MDIYDKLFQYYHDKLTVKHPRVDAHIVEKAAHAHTTIEIEEYDAQSDFERIWNQVLEAAA